MWAAVVFPSFSSKWFSKEGWRYFTGDFCCWGVSPESKRLFNIWSARILVEIHPCQKLMVSRVQFKTIETNSRLGIENFFVDPNVTTPLESVCWEQKYPNSSVNKKNSDFCLTSKDRQAWKNLDLKTARFIPSRDAWLLPWSFQTGLHPFFVIASETTSFTLFS